MAPTAGEVLEAAREKLRELERQIETLLRTESLTPSEILELERELVRIRAA